MFVDTHVHLSHDRYTADIDLVIERARANGVSIMVMPAIDVPSIERAIDLCEQFEGLFAMTALHPSYVKDATDADFERIVEFVENESVIAIGESGLDYYWDRSFDAKQEAYLRRHVQLAIATDLPLILHNREASEDLLTFIAEEKNASANGARLRGIFHCFSGPAAIGEAAIDLGFHVGIGGNVTYKNSPTKDALRGIDLRHIVLETDGPYLAPVPYRGKRNEPGYVPLIAEVVAEAKGLSVRAVEEQTTSNALALFAIDAK